MTPRVRLALFAVLTSLLLAGAGAYVRHAARRGAATVADSGVAWLTGTPPSAPYLLFRSTTGGPTFGHVAYVPLARLDGPRYLTPLECQRVFFRDGRGVCLTADADRRYPARATIFDASFHPGPAIRLTGPPSRARVSADGRSRP